MPLTGSQIKIAELVAEAEVRDEKMRRELRGLQKYSEKQINKIVNEFNRVERKGVSAFKRIGNSVKNVFAAGIAIAGVKKLGDAWSSFETAMAEVSTIVDTSVVSIENLRNSILDLSRRVPQSANQLAKGLYQVISAGVTDTSDALMLLEESAKTATAGLTSTFTAVDIGTTIINAYGLKVSDINKVNDVLFNTVKEGKTTFEQLAGSLGTAVPFAAQAEISIEELTAALATLTKGGLSTDESVTALRQTIATYLKPTNEAASIAKKLGIEFSTAALKSKGLLGAFKDLIKLQETNSDIVQQLFPNIRALTGVFALAGKQSEEFGRILKSNQGAAGVANEAFEKINKTAGAQWQLIKNNLNVELQRLGVKILPSITSAFKKLNETMNETPISRIEKEIGRLQSSIDNLNSPINRFFDYFVGDNPKRIEEMQDKIKALKEELHNLIMEAGGDLQLAPEFKSGSFKDALDMISDKTKGKGANPAIVTNDDDEFLKKTLKRYDDLNKGRDRFDDDVFKDDFGAKLQKDVADDIDKSYNKALKNIRKGFDDEIIPASERLKQSLEDNAFALSRMVANGAKFEDIIFSIASIAAQTLIPGIGGKILGGIIPGFANGVTNYKIPSGFPNDSFIAGFTSGEHLSVTPAGQAGDEAREISKLGGKLDMVNIGIAKLAMRQIKVENQLNVDNRRLYLNNKVEEKRESSFR